MNRFNTNDPKMARISYVIAKLHLWLSQELCPSPGKLDHFKAGRSIMGSSLEPVVTIS